MSGASHEAFALPPDSVVPALAQACRAAGGRALVVGGWVRDRLLGLPRPDHDEPDLDLEVSGLSPDALEAVLSRFGPVRRVGRAFPVFLLRGPGVDVSLPRADPAEATPAGDTWPGFDPGLDFAAAARGRDLTIDAMGWDPLSGELLDPLGGRRDLARRRLRAACPERFAADPLRGLRTARLSACLGMEPDAELLALCAATDLAAVPGERMLEEFRKLWLRAARPSRALALLRETDLLAELPWLAALEGVPQDPVWHPEGDVFTHTLRVLDAAAALRGLRSEDEERDVRLMFGALCHDLGKPATTEERDGRIVSPGHSEAGIAPTEALLGRLRASKATIRAVVALVRHHLAPAHFVRRGAAGDDAGPRAYRRLARRLAEAGVDFELLERVARADHLGRTTADALAGRFEAGDVFLERARRVGAEPAARQGVVRARHLLARGFEPGPELGRMLARCRDVEDDTGWTDPEQILSRALETRTTEAED